MRVNYSAEKRRRELDAKRKKEEKAAKAAERKAHKGENVQGDSEEYSVDGDSASDSEPDNKD